MRCDDTTRAFSKLHGFDLLDPTQLATAREIGPNGFRGIMAGIGRGAVCCASCDKTLQPGHSLHMARVYALGDFGKAPDGRVLDAIVIACQACFDRFGGLDGTLALLGKRVIRELGLDASVQSSARPLAHTARLAGNLSVTFRWTGDRVDAEWSPGIPAQLGPKVRRKYVAARDTFMRKLANRLGEGVIVAGSSDVQAFAPRT
jgi:hypothetical protein